MTSMFKIVLNQHFLVLVYTKSLVDVHTWQNKTLKEDGIVPIAS
jgi:hypothetical protein